MQNDICGIDEAGRGCIAGSLFVCGILSNENTINKIYGIKDSKQLTRTMRDRIFQSALALKIPYFVLKYSAKEIDEKGISLCMQHALQSIQSHLKSQTYLFDGNTSFGVDNIQCIIKGDSKIPQISLASIIAKSLKDKESDELHLKYPQYNLAKHKGYATKEHIESIQKYGYLPIHRRSFHIKSLES